MADHQPRSKANRAQPGRHGLIFFLPAVIWAVYFVIVYSAQGAACAAGEGVSSVVLVSLTLAGLIGIGAVGLWGYRNWRRVRPEDWDKRPTSPTREAFLAFATITHAILFFVATVWVGAAIPVLDPCAGHVIAI